MNWLAQLLVGLVGAIGEKLFAPKPPPEPPAAAPEPPGFKGIDAKIDKELAARERDSTILPPRTTPASDPRDRAGDSGAMAAATEPPDSDGVPASSEPPTVPTGER